MIHSYPSIFALGHRAIAELLLDQVVVEEKIDGSQFSFRRNINTGELECRSKGAQLNILAPEKMFGPAVTVAQSLDLRPGWTYRAEFLAKPKHNTLAYDRVPAKFLILFDIDEGTENFLTPNEKLVEAAKLGLEMVPTIFEGRIDDISTFRAMLDRTSVLGGQKIEGVVVKNYHRFGIDKHVLMGKFVSEAFKEVHQGEWRTANPTTTDTIQGIVADLTTPARWQKAIQHLRERGEIEDSPRDIGKLIQEVQADIKKECLDEIRERLLHYAMPHLMRGVIQGLPEWYKEQLLKRQFEQ